MISLIVLNDDSVICESCWEPPELEIDPGQVPFGRTSHGECKSCGLTIGGGAPSLWTIRGYKPNSHDVVSEHKPQCQVTAEPSNISIPMPVAEASHFVGHTLSSDLEWYLDYEPWRQLEEVAKNERFSAEYVGNLYRAVLTEIAANHERLDRDFP